MSEAQHCKGVELKAPGGTGGPMQLICITCGAEVSQWPAKGYFSHQAAKWIRDGGKLFARHARETAKAGTPK